MMRIRVSGFILLALVCCRLDVLAQKDGDDIVIGKYRVLHSAIFDEDRTLLVHLPLGYESDRIRYPVLFHLYGDNIVDYIAPAMIACDKLGETGEAPPVIIVGVVNTNRYRDNLAFNRDGSAGGADRFIRFFREELIPFIDREYRTADFRIIVGPQAGAHFALYSLITESDLFDMYITTNPFEGDSNVSGGLARAVEQYFQNTEPLQKFFYMTCEEDAPPADIERARRVSALLESRKPDRFEFHCVFLKPSGFFITPVPVLEGLRTFFVDYRLPQDFPAESVADLKTYYERLSRKYGFHVDVPELMLTFAADNLSQRRRMKETIELLEYQLTLYPQSLNAFWRLGEAYRTMAQYDKALSHYKAFLAIQSSDADMVARRARELERYIKDSASYAVEQEIEKAGVKAGLKLARKLRGDPQNKLYFEETEFNAIGYRLMGEGRLDDAIAVFKLNVEMYPESANTYDSLAEAYMKKGEKKLAVENFEQSLKLNPQNKNAEEKLKELRK
ncbi:MAG TPA: alpha/beta hydrolase-fold protein [Candidatus Desulfaltia sp.]|nr:alpha/beta hydrolase-fold protein [Candidatus Desulfaltia sp.]